MTNNDISQPKRALALSNEAYDAWTKIVTLYLPGLAALYSGLAIIWGFPAGEQVVGSIALVVVFGKLVLNASKRAYIASDADKDGSIAVDPSAGEVTRFDLGLTAEQLAGKDSITLKVNEGHVQD